MKQPGADNTLHVYTRVSTVAQEDHGTSLDTQERLGRDKAVSLGFEFQLWNEGGRSSNHEDVSERPVLASLIDGVEKGHIKHIYVQDDSRLSRVDQTASYLRARFRKHGVKLYTKDGMYDFDNPTDNLTKSLMDAVAQYDNAIRTTRFRQGKLHRVRQGSWHGGPPPFGYRLEDKKLVVDDVEAGTVRTIFEKYAAGESINSLRVNLIASGVAPRRGGRWSIGSIAALLKNTHYVGYYAFTDKKFEETVEVPCPAIIPSALWLQVVELQRANAERNGQRNRTTRFYLLRDLMYCGHCGRPLAARTNEAKNEHFYYCPNKERRWSTDRENSSKYSRRDNCGFARSMNINKADELVWNTAVGLHAESTTLREEVKQRLIGDIVSPTGGYAVARQKTDVVIKRLERDLRYANEAIDTLEIDKRLQRIGEDSYNRQVVRLREHRQQLEGQLDLELNGLVNQEAERRWVDWVRAFGDELRSHDTYSSEERKHYLMGMVRRIDVRFLKDTLEHELTIEFTRPIVGDGLDKSHKPFVPIPGSSSKAVRLKGARSLKRATPVGNYSATVE